MVSDEVVGLTGGDGLRYEQIGPVELKGVSRPVVLHRVDRGTS